MSKIDLLEDEEIQHLAENSLVLCTVFDNGATKPVLTVLPVSFDQRLPHAEAARRWLSSLGMQGDAVAIKALIAISRDAMPAAMKRKKAKA